MTDETVTPEDITAVAPDAVTTTGVEAVSEPLQPSPVAAASDAAPAETSTETPAEQQDSDSGADGAGAKAEAVMQLADEVDHADQGGPVVEVGDVVHVAMDRGVNTGDCRPAIVVRVWNAETINAQMFSDGLNDHQDYASGMAWLTSLRYAKPVAGQPMPPNTWHWRWEE